MAGIFITIEGADGCGKTTQLERLGRFFRQQGHQVVQTREPGGTVIADKIRRLLLNPAHCEMTARAEALLYMAARAQHTEELIRPALTKGAVVISDRYSDSTLVYQGVARGLPCAELAELNRFATGNLVPDLTLLLDAAVEELSSRLVNRGEKDRLDNEGIDFHRQVRSGFLAMAARESQRFRVIDAGRDVEEVWRAIEGCVREFLTKRGQDHADADQ